MPTHKCSSCAGEFPSDEAYCEHECESAAGAKPTEAEYLKRTTTANYDKIAEAAQARTQN